MLGMSGEWEKARPDRERMAHCRGERVHIAAAAIGEHAHAAQLTLNNGKKGSALLQALPLTARVYGTGSARLGTVGGTPAQHAP